MIQITVPGYSLLSQGSQVKQLVTAHTVKSRDKLMHDDCLLACVQLDFSTLSIVQDLLCLEDGAAHSGLALPESVDLR